MGDEDSGSAGADEPVAQAPGVEAAVARPDASGRDPDETATQLRAWLQTVLPEGSDPTVESVTVPESNGMSSVTVLFDATWGEPGGTPLAAGRASHELVARIAPEESSVPVFETYDLSTQFRTMARVRELCDVPVPEVLWLEEDSAALGAPFFVMRRAHGQVPPDVMPYNFEGSWVRSATPEQLARMESSTVDVLVALHGIEDAAGRFADLADSPVATGSPAVTGSVVAGSGTAGGSALRRHVTAQRAYYDWVTSDGLRSPLIERAFDWMEANWPADDSDVVLSWGDARIGNVMYQGFEPVAVLDWEMASLAPREVDLAWMIFLHRFFEDVATMLDLDGMPEFMRRDRLESMYEQRSGHTPRDMDFYCVYAALRHAVVMSQVQRRAIAFGLAEMPDDVDDLIMHRAALAEMLDGNYWDRVLRPGRGS